MGGVKGFVGFGANFDSEVTSPAVGTNVASFLVNDVDN